MLMHHLEKMSPAPPSRGLPRILGGMAAWQRGALRPAKYFAIQSVDPPPTPPKPPERTKPADITYKDVPPAVQASFLLYLGVQVYTMRRGGATILQYP